MSLRSHFSVLSSRFVFVFGSVFGVRGFGVRSAAIAPDCGMKYLPREVADGKLRATVEGARIMREEITG